MALAVYLLWSTYRCEAAFKRIYDAPPIPHAFTLLVFMNAPANLLRWAWFYHVDGVWSDAMFVALIGLLWYWVALSICSWRERRSIVLFSSAPMRVVADLALIAMGPTIALGFRPVDVAHLPWLWRIPVAACFLVWSLGPVIIFGHDLIDCFRRKGSLSGKAA
jgi:hypothetical protein